MLTFLFYINHLFVYSLNGFKNLKWLNISLWPRDGMQTSTTSLEQCGPGTNGNEGVHLIPQNSRTGPSPSGGFVS